jgi:hypothetical protein
MPVLLFNNKRPATGGFMDTPSQDAIENSLNLRQVSLENAARYGGSVTRNALGLLNLHGDRKHIIVDTKIHFLMKGMCPSIPGWHTDGVPRLDNGQGDPVLSGMTDGTFTEPRYHLLVTGTLCPTRFLTNTVLLDSEDLLEGGPDKLYTNMSDKINEDYDGDFIDTEDSVMYEWNWWNIHTAQVANARGWRYLIRVTETDYIEPRTNPADFIRTQNNVYTPTNFGW